MSVRNYAPKKKRTKTFDTKLFLFGSGFLLVLLILGLFFTGSLSRRSADNMLAAANQSYEKASYAQAISGYNKFITKFPHHSGVSAAKIRRALARIRFAVDEQSDYINAYNTAAEEIVDVGNEPEFFEVSKAELSILLPKIAAGLADEAQTKTSLFAAERAELTLSLLDKLLPNSLRPVEQIAAVKAKIKTVRRIIACQNVLKEAAEKLNELLKTMPFDGLQVGKCYAVIDSLLPEYPELAAQQEFRNLMRTVAEKESNAVIEITAPNIGRQSGFPPAEKQVCSVLAVLAKQNPPAKTEDRGTRLNLRIYPFYYEENLYGINLQYGTLTWKQPLKNFAPPGMKPKTLLIHSSKSMKQDGFIIVNPENGTFRRYESTTGKLLAEFTLNEKLFVSDIVQNETVCFFAASAENGKLTLFEVNNDSVKPAVSYQLPQKVDSPPVVDLLTGSVLQFAESQTLFKIPLQNKKQNTLSFYTGHSPLTIRTAPVMFGTYCLLIRQTGANTCELAVFTFDKEVKERELQTFPISGLVDYPIQIDGKCCAVLSDEGEISLFEKSSSPDEPLQLSGKGSAGNSAETGINRSAVFRNNEVWIAGNQLMSFAFHPAQNRFLPQKALRTEIETQMPVFVFLHRMYESVLIHCFTEPDWGGLQIAAYFLSDLIREGYSLRWTAEVAAPVIQEPQLFVKGGNKFLTVYTSNGKSWQTSLNGQRYSPLLELPAGTFGIFNNGIKNVKIPLGRVIPLKDNYSAWVAASKEVRIFDPTAKENRFNTITLPSPPAGLPLELDGYLLVPPENEPLILYDVKTCKPAASFKPLRHIGNPPKWTAPAVIPQTNSFLIADNQDKENLLYLITLRTENNNPQMIQEKCFALERPVVSPLCVSDNKAVFVNDRNVLHILNLNSDEKEPEYEFSEELTSECIRGPYTAGSGFILATKDGKVWCYAADGKLHSESMPLPVGLPFCNGESILVNSADGVVRQFSLKTFQTEFNIETGLKLSAGPVMIDDKIYLSGRDGTVYFISL